MMSTAAAGRTARRLGRRGERLAARWLRRRGYRILARNLCTANRELDLLVESPDGRCVIVVEVKSGRQSLSTLLQRLSADQIRRLQSMARSLHAGRLVRRRPMRIDVVLVQLGPIWRCRIRHLKGGST